MTFCIVLVWQYQPTWTVTSFQIVLTNHTTFNTSSDPLMSLPSINSQLKEIVNFSEEQQKSAKTQMQIDELIEQKLNRTANKFPIEFEHVDKRHCHGLDQTDVQLKLTIVVKCRLNGFKNRKYIRKSWGSTERKLAGVKLNVMFAVGSCLFADSDCEEEISIEQSQHGDLIQGDFKDTYNNNTLKTTMIFKWYNEYCASVNLVIVDDDFYVSIKNLIIYITQKPFESEFIRQSTS